jgi:hypothetical protein
MQNYPNKTKEMFIVRALEKILTDKDIKRQGQLKKACESAIATLKGSDRIGKSFVIDFSQPVSLFRGNQGGKWTNCDWWVGAIDGTADAQERLVQHH